MNKLSEMKTKGFFALMEKRGMVSAISAFTVAMLALLPSAGCCADAVSHESDQGIASTAYPPQAVSEEDLFQNGTDLLMAGKWVDAIAEFRTLLVLHPANTGAHFQLGCAYALEGAYDTALEEFDTALASAQIPDTAFCFFNKAGVYVKKALLSYEAGRSDEGAVYLRQAAQDFRKTAEILPEFTTPAEFGRFCKTSIPLAKSGYPLGFAMEKDGYPPSSCIFLEGAEASTAGADAFTFGLHTVPMLYFWRASGAYLIVGVSYALRGQYTQANRYLNETMERLSFEIARYTHVYVPPSLVSPQKGSVSEERAQAIQALILLCKGQREGAREMASVVLSAQPDEYIARNVIKAVGASRAVTAAE